MMIVDAQIHLWSKGTPSAHHRQTPFLHEEALAMMDAAGVDRAVLVGTCSSAWTTLLAAALHPDRVLGIVNVATWVPFLTPPLPWRAVYDFDTDPGTDEGWARDTRRNWLRDWRGFAEFFFAELLPEPHSSKQYEDCVGWVMETSAEANLLFRDASLCRPAVRRPRRAWPG